MPEPLDVKDIHTTNFQLLDVDFNRFTDILVLRTKHQKKILLINLVITVQKRSKTFHQIHFRPSEVGVLQ